VLTLLRRVVARLRRELDYLNFKSQSLGYGMKRLASRLLVQAGAK